MDDDSTGSVFKAGRLLYHSTADLRVIEKRKKNFVYAPRRRSAFGSHLVLLRFFFITLKPRVE